MKVKTTKATDFGRNSFGKVEVQDLGFEKEYYTITVEELEGRMLPDAKAYGIKADDYVKSQIKFKPWDDPDECKYAAFDVVDGKACNFREIDWELYKASIRFVEFEQKTTEAQKNAIAKYRNKMARVDLTITQEEKEEIKEKAEAKGLSIKQYLMELVRADI